LGRPGVNVDLHPALVHDPPGLCRVLGRRVRDRWTLVAVGHRAGDAAREDDRVLEAAHTGITPCFLTGRSTPLSGAMRSPLMIVRRVSRGSMMSSTRSLRAAR